MGHVALKSPHMTMSGIGFIVAIFWQRIVLMKICLKPLEVKENFPVKIRLTSIGVSSTSRLLAAAVDVAKLRRLVALEKVAVGVEGFAGMKVGIGWTIGADSPPVSSIPSRRMPTGGIGKHSSSENK